jgi:hypothetical protein
VSEHLASEFSPAHRIEYLLSWRVHRALAAAIFSSAEGGDTATANKTKRSLDRCSKLRPSRFRKAGNQKNEMCVAGEPRAFDILNVV